MHDPKYDVTLSGKNRGRLKNRETGEYVPEGEPIFLLRAKDKHAVPTLKDYLSRCKNQDHARVIRRRIKEFASFKRLNPSVMKEPD